MSDLQTILDSSLISAGAAVKAVFDREERRLSAEELRAFWKETRMFAVSTTGNDGAPHIAPVHVLMGEDDALEMAIFEDSVRLRDLHATRVSPSQPGRRTAASLSSTAAAPRCRIRAGRPGRTAAGS